jgi:RNA polymerase sigma-70 factor (ECF subfamily)
MWERLRRQLMRLAGSADVDDHLHTAFVKWEDYRERGEVRNPEAFLLRMAMNSAYDQHRRSRRRPQVSILDETDLPDAAPLQDEAYAVRQRLDLVREGLSDLPHRTREIFLMHRLDGLKYTEIGARLGISASAVEKHVAKAMRHLAQLTKGW